ncbi:hypothetical protein D3C77_391790 [compost metagenome]
MSEHKQEGKRSYPSKVSRSLIGHSRDVEFSEERADQDDWEALERSERADRRQQHRYL